MNNSTAFRTIGQSRPRADGHLKVMGAATYAAEWNVPELTYGAVVDSAIACGSIRSIDTTAALKVPGVIAVITHENAPRLASYSKKGGGFQLTGEGGLGEARQPLQGPAIFYGAQSVAVVVAETPEQAHYAATLVKIVYNEQTPELVMETASRQVFPKMFAGTEPMQKQEREVQTYLESAPFKLVREYESPVHHHNPIEILSSIAAWEERNGEEYLTLYDTTRAVDMLRDICAHSFNLPKANIHVISKFIGGAFGSKAWSFHNPVLVALAARHTKRPLKIEWRRQQVFSIGGHRPGMKQSITLGATNYGKLSTIIHSSHTHSSPVSGYTEFGARMTRMMYDASYIAYSSQLSHLNIPTPSVMRGPGFLIGGWALESALDELAHELDLDPVELRLTNYADIDPDSGLPFSNKHLRECYERGKELFGWEQRNARPRSKKAGNNFIGYGMASAMHPADQQKASAEATIFADGTAEVRTATHELGNGAYTIFEQIAADGLRLPVERVHFNLGDTTFPAAPPTHGSITTATVGPAVFRAAQKAIEDLKKVAVKDTASPLYGASADEIEAADGRLFLREKSGQGEDYNAILRRAGLSKVSGTADAGPGSERKKFAFYSFGAVFAEVRIDEQTGVIRVTRLCGVYDTGRLINPRTAHSQVMGGMLFSLGATLMEETLFDPNNGLPVVRNLADYHIPSCADTPKIKIEFLNIPDVHINELGAHGVGEIGTNGIPPAITNAIFNATGKRLRSLPVTPDKIIAG